MSKRVVRKIRYSQLISPYGPGAVFDVMGESFMMPTADAWRRDTKYLRRLDCPRLELRLGVANLFSPPMDEDPDLPSAVGIRAVRFPRWLFCQTCRRMFRWNLDDETGTQPVCKSDQSSLVPMRFVVACKDGGHADDVPWPQWLHRGQSGSDQRECRRADALRFLTALSGGRSLSSLKVACDACGASETLGQLNGENLRQKGLGCPGTQPWGLTASEKGQGGCDSALEVLQRGATSLHFGLRVSALDIPEIDQLDEPTDADRIRAHRLATLLETERDETIRAYVMSQIADEVGLPPHEVDRLLGEGNKKSQELLQDVRSDMLAGEFMAFVGAADAGATHKDFRTSTLLVPSETSLLPGFSRLMSEVVLVHRLREVTAFVGFTRTRPDAKTIVPGTVVRGDEDKWLPAVEGYGEGFMIRFRHDVLAEWTQLPAVQRRIQSIKARLAASDMQYRLPAFSDEYVVLHVLAHGLISELAFSAGYPAASLRERIYSEGRSQGVLIYTTTPDVEGTLGGLVREGQPHRLEVTLAKMLERLAWCSNDPVCAESGPHSLDGLNLAACHSCLMAAETSCECNNLLLDRLLLVGSAELELPNLFDVA